MIILLGYGVNILLSINSNIFIKNIFFINYYFLVLMFIIMSLLQYKILFIMMNCLFGQDIFLWIIYYFLVSSIHFFCFMGNNFLINH